MLSLPYFGLGMGMGGMGLGGGGFGAGGVEGGIGSDRSAVTYEKLPIGEVAVRRGDHVHATDGRIGRVRGLVIDQHDDHVTHLLLDEGHLWGKKEVAIPISAVTSVDDGVVLTLSKDEVRDLPAVAVDHQG
jgi:sporulation protein YlmC with PRC-barrel domain